MHQPLNHERFKASEMDNIHGTLMIEARSDTAFISSRTPLTIQVKFKTAVTVSSLMALIPTKKLEYYDFNREGCGCLFWQLTLLQEFKNVGWISEAELEDVRTKVHSFALQDTETVPYPPVQGTFVKNSD